MCSQKYFWYSFISMKDVFGFIPLDQTNATFNERKEMYHLKKTSYYGSQSDYHHHLEKTEEAYPTQADSCQVLFISQVFLFDRWLLLLVSRCFSFHWFHFLFVIRIEKKNSHQKIIILQCTQYTHLTINWNNTGENVVLITQTSSRFKKLILFDLTGKSGLIYVYLIIPWWKNESFGLTFSSCLFLFQRFVHCTLVFSCKWIVHGGKLIRFLKKASGWMKAKLKKFNISAVTRYAWSSTTDWKQQLTSTCWGH